MAAVEHLLISKVLNDSDITEAIAKGVQSQHFAGHYADAWQWIVEHAQKHGDVPSERQFALEHPSIPIEDTSAETVSGLVEELFKSYSVGVLAEGLSNAVQALDADDTERAIDEVKGAITAATSSTDVLVDTNLAENWLERYEEYKRRKNTDREFYGIRTGFPTLDDWTGGYKPPNFILFVGEPKRGKSLYSLLSAKAAWEMQGKKILYISFEMGTEEIATRFDALSTGVPINALNTGTLTERELQTIYDEMHLRNKGHFIISEDQHRLTTMDSVRAKCIEHEPDMVVVDGMYMMRAAGKRADRMDERETLTHVTRSAKFLAQELDLVFLGTTQVLPGKVMGKARKIEANAIGYTSSFIQDPDLIIGCEQDQDHHDQMTIRVVEGRNVPKDQTISVRWDWKKMDFTEVGPKEIDDDDDGYY